MRHDFEERNKENNLRRGEKRTKGLSVSEVPENIQPTENKKSHSHFENMNYNSSVLMGLHKTVRSPDISNSYFNGGLILL